MRSTTTVLFPLLALLQANRVAAEPIPITQSDAAELDERNGLVQFIVSPNFSPFDLSCTSGTVITQSSATAKGNFSPGQYTIRITHASPGCHISLYLQPNQQGDVNARLSTNNVGSMCQIIAQDNFPWLSYGYYCP